METKKNKTKNYKSCLGELAKANVEKNCKIYSKELIEYIKMIIILNMQCAFFWVIYKFSKDLLTPFVITMTTFICFINVFYNRIERKIFSTQNLKNSN